MGVVLAAVAHDRDHEHALGGSFLQDGLEFPPVVGLAVGDHEGEHDRLLVGIPVAELLVVVRQRRLPGRHDVGLAAPFDLAEPAPQVAGVEVADLDMPVAEPVCHQPPELVTAAGLLGGGLAVLPLQHPDQAMQRLDHDGPPAAGIGPFGPVLIGGTPVHAGRQVQQEHRFLLAVGRDGRPDLTTRSAVRAARFCSLVVHDRSLRQGVSRHFATARITRSTPYRTRSEPGIPGWARAAPGTP